MYILALFLGGVGDVEWKVKEGVGLLESLFVCRLLGQGYGGQGAPMGAEWVTSHEQNGLPPIVNSMWIALGKSRSVRGASHQPAFMGSCLNISLMF